MVKLSKTAFLTFVMMVMALSSCAQVALRTNLAYDATLTPNLGIEFRIDSAWTMGANVGLNAWDIDSKRNKKWRHLLVAPNIRRYFGHKTKRSSNDSIWGLPANRSRQMSYLEIDPIYSHYNVSKVKFPFGLYPSVEDRRLQGDLVALGAKYGYSWILGRDWHIEAEAGIAVGYAWFKEYECAVCGSQLGEGNRIFLLPQLGINIVYIIN